MQLCARFRSRVEQFPVLHEPDFISPEVAERFIRFVYRHLPPASDLCHSGSYSPGLRDEAQYFRDGLLTQLSGNTSPLAEKALQNLMEAPEMSSVRDVIAHLLESRSERMADSVPWSENEVRDFSERYEAMPKTADDLFHIVCRRLDGIKYDVEQAEESLRYNIREGDEESHLQAFLVSELRRRNNGRYTAPKEPEVDGGERPDVQIHRPGIDGNIQIELKLADMASRSLSSLLADLEGQLAGQYLRARDAKYGIFVVGFAACRTRRGWLDPESNENLSFREVIVRLQERADFLSRTIDDVERLHVIGIDFRTPE